MKPPKSLKKSGKQLWEDLNSGWEIVPEQLVILQDLCETQDRLSQLATILREEGQLVRDRYGHPKPHPASVMLKAEIANFSHLWRMLQLEAPSGVDVRPGRPMDGNRSIDLWLKKFASDGR